MSRITHIVLRHKLLVVLTWLIVAVAGFATLSTTTKHLTADFALPGQPGYVADQKIAALYHSGGDAVPTVLTATAPAGTTVTSPAGTAAAGRVFDAATAAWPGSRVADIANTGDRHLATADGRTAFALVFTPGQGGMNQKDPTPVLQRAAAGSAPAGWTTAVTGLAQLETGGQTKSGSGSAATEAVFGGLGALVVLAFVFASFIAFVPLLMAIIAIPSTFLLVLGLTEVSSVSVIVEFLIALIGLGVAIDYSLLVVNRWREQRAKGWDNTAAVVHAMDHAGRAVVFSGLTVAISLLALVVLPVPFLANIGFAGFFIPIVSIAVAVTLLPVLLATVGPRLDWPHIRHEGVASRPWTAWARLVLR
ncbi:MAG: MMPL family transporter, partial [Acidimicrobiales bacterium]